MAELCNQIWTEEAFKDVPALFSQDNKGDEAIAYIEYLDREIGWLWYVLGYNSRTGEAYGFLRGVGSDLGCFRLTGNDVCSLQEINDKCIEAGKPCRIERSLSFKPTTLSELKSVLW